MNEICRQPNDGPDESPYRDTRRYRAVSLTRLFNVDHIFKRERSRGFVCHTDRNKVLHLWPMVTNLIDRQTFPVFTTFESSSTVLTIAHSTFDFSFHCVEMGWELVNSQGPKEPITDLLAAGTCPGLAAHWIQPWGRGSMDMTELTQALFRYYYHRNSNKWKRNNESAVGAWDSWEVELREALQHKTKTLKPHYSGL